MVALVEENVVEAPSQDIEEMFTSLPIARIQKLRDEYAERLKTTRSGLHSLVENKYRDLIHIADDIGHMYDDTLDLDGKLSSLSYKQSRFVGFSKVADRDNGRISFSQRGQLLSDPIGLSNNTLSYVIHKYLIEFDLRLGDGVSSIYQTSECVYYAKIFHALETMIRKKGISDEDTHLFEHLRVRFNAYLEGEIACYNSYYISSYSNNNEKVNKDQQFTSFSVTNENENALERTDVFDDERSDDVDEGDGGLRKEQKAVSQVRKCAPILNYLISYVILNSSMSDFQSLDDLLKKFIEIRRKHLSSVLYDVSTNSENKCVNFQPIFKFIINTVNFSQIYFAGKQSDLFKYLKRVTHDGRISDLIDFSDWIDDVPIKFDSEIMFSVESNKNTFERVSSTLKELSRCLFDFTKSTYDSSSVEDFEKSSRIVEIFYQYVSGLLKMHDEIELNGMDPTFIDFLINVDGEEIINKTLLDIKVQIEMFYKLHFERLISDKQNNIFSKLIDKLATHPEVINSLDLFPTDLFTKTHSSNLFVRAVAKFSNASQVNHSCEELCDWFNISSQLLTMIDLSASVANSSSSSNNHLFQLINTLERHEKTGKELKFGSFSLQKLHNHFADLSRTAKEDLWQTIKHFIESLERKVSQEENHDFRSAFFLLTVLTSLEERYSSMESTSKRTMLDDINDSFCKVSRSAYKAIFNHSASVYFDGFFLTFSKESVANIKEPTSNIPTRPSLKLASMLYKLSSCLQGKLDGNNSINYGYLYSNRKLNKEFITLKNDWFRKSLIEPLVKNLIDYHRQENLEDSNSNGNNEREEPKDDHVESKGESGLNEMNKDVTTSKKQNYSQVIADILFLIQFTEQSSIDVDSPLVKSSLKELSSIEAGIEKESLEIIMRGVCDFFKSKKYIYLPLSIN